MPNGEQEYNSPWTTKDYKGRTDRIYSGYFQGTRTVGSVTGRLFNIPQAEN